jgi:NADP-dependent 3-hydroxy acid dehydrogenase YdfG
VTGGGSGIGKMIATALVANGAKVYIAARKEKQLNAVRRRMVDET